MKIIIEAEPKEVSALVVAIQERQIVFGKIDSGVIMKNVKDGNGRGQAELLCQAEIDALLGAQ